MWVNDGICMREKGCLPNESEWFSNEFHAQTCFTTNYPQKTIFSWFLQRGTNGFSQFAARSILDSNGKFLFSPSQVFIPVSESFLRILSLFSKKRERITSESAARIFLLPAFFHLSDFFPSSFFVSIQNMLEWVLLRCCSLVLWWRLHDPRMCDDSLLSLSLCLTLSK
jgi:hypothetical protein